MIRLVSCIFSFYSPELVGGDVLFTDYELVAGKRDSFGKSECGEILKKFYDAAVKKDLAVARTYLANDRVFVGLFQTYRSLDEYLKALTGLLQVTVRLEVKRIIGQGNDAVVFFDLETRAPAEGKVLVAEWHQFKDGKISHVQSAFDGRPYAVRISDLDGDLFDGDERRYPLSWIAKLPCNPQPIDPHSGWYDHGKFSRPFSR
jgi:hypothetical protein